MEPVTFKATTRTLEKMRKFYDSQIVACEDDDVLFKAKIIGCTITAYKNQEVSFEGIKAQIAYERWAKKPTAKKKPITLDTLERPYLGSHIGSDDIGDNNFFGPICTVACYVDEKDIPWLLSLNIQNAKMMTAQEIVNAAKQIKERLVYSLLILDNPHYNKMISDGNNAAHIKAKLHNQAVCNVMQRLKKPCDVKVIEYFVASKTYYNYLKGEVITVKDIHFEKNSYQDFIAVSCAYILAQYASLQYFNNMSRSLKVKLPRGSGPNVDVVATELVQSRGEAILHKVAKKNFPNTKRILQK